MREQRGLSEAKTSIKASGEAASSEAEQSEASMTRALSETSREQRNPNGEHLQKSTSEPDRVVSAVLSYPVGPGVEVLRAALLSDGVERPNGDFIVHGNGYPSYLATISSIAKLYVTPTSRDELEAVLSKDRDDVTA